MDLRPVRYYEDPDFDVCGNSTYAVIEHNGLKLALCQECYKSLVDCVKELETTIFCYQCKHFGMSLSGFKYGGSCLRRSPTPLSKEQYGYDFCVDSMDTCKDAERKE